MLKPFHVKKALAFAFDHLFINQFLFSLQVHFSSPFIRAIYYHDISVDEVEQFERHIQYYSTHFSPVTYEDLIQFNNTKRWDKKRPGLILTFDDGHRSFFEVAAPILEQYGFTGWFFIPTKFLDIAIEEQNLIAKIHRIFPKSSKSEKDRIFLTWEHVLELDKKHVIGCHSFSHKRLGANLSSDQLHEEIITSKQMLEEKLAHPVDVFAWVGGEETSYCKQALNLMKEAGYRVVFQTNNSKIQKSTNLINLDRTNIESSFSLYLVRFQLSGVLDLLYTAKRNRVLLEILDE